MCLWLVLDISKPCKSVELRIKSPGLVHETVLIVDHQNYKQIHILEPNNKLVAVPVNDRAFHEYKTQSEMNKFNKTDPIKNKIASEKEEMRNEKILRIVQAICTHTCTI